MTHAAANDRQLRLLALGLLAIIAACVATALVAGPWLARAILGEGCGRSGCPAYVTEVRFLQPLDVAGGRLELTYAFAVVLDGEASRRLGAGSDDAFQSRVRRFAEAGAVKAVSPGRVPFVTGTDDPAAAALQDAVLSTRIESEVGKLLAAVLVDRGMGKADARAAVEVERIDVLRRRLSSDAGPMGGQADRGRTGEDGR